MSDDDDSEMEFSDIGGLHISGMLDAQGVREAHEALSVKYSEGYVSPEDYARLEKLKGLSELFEEVLFWCWNYRGADGQFKLRRFPAAQNRFVALTALVKPDFFDGMSYDEIGNRIGVTKQNLSNMARDFQKEFGLKFRRSHRETELHSAAAKKTWANGERPRTWRKEK